jgi:hypothetical protein
LVYFHQRCEVRGHIISLVTTNIQKVQLAINWIIDMLVLIWFLVNQWVGGFNDLLIQILKHGPIICSIGCCRVEHLQNMIGISQMSIWIFKMFKTKVMNFFYYNFFDLNHSWNNVRIHGFRNPIGKDLGLYFNFKSFKICITS